MGSRSKYKWKCNQSRSNPNRAKGKYIERVFRYRYLPDRGLNCAGEKWNEQRKNGKLNSKNLPVERIYPVKDKTIRNRLNMTYGSVKKA